MSGAALVLEAVGISAAAVGVVLAQNPPEDLQAWWDRQEWLHRMIMPMERPDEPQDLSILPWTPDPGLPALEPGPVDPPAGENPLGDTA